MNRLMPVIGLLMVVSFQVTSCLEPSAYSAAAKYDPSISWYPDSVVTGDFKCRGRKQQAIMGIGPSETVIAIFLNGTKEKPVVLRDSSRNRDAVWLATESLDYDLEKLRGHSRPGFRRSRTCKGLVLSDSEINSLHIYWDHTLEKFDSFESAQEWVDDEGTPKD